MKKTILLTGGTSGIGRASALELVEKGHNLIVPARNLKKIEDFALDLKNRELGTIDFFECDLSSQNSLKAFVEKVKNKYQSIDILINNAGIWNSEFKLTEDNIEETFAVNIFAPYFLTQEFLPLIDAGIDKRIIFTSSGLHGGRIHFEDIQFKNKYSSFLVYQQSKLAIILMTKYFAQKYKDKGISFNCFHPGMINTNIGITHKKTSNFFFQLFGSTPEKGAQTLVYLALNEDIQDVSGEYFANKKIVKTKGVSNNFEIANRLINQIDEYILKK